MADEVHEKPDEQQPEEKHESVSELLDQLGRDTRALLVGLAFLAAFALANVAAVSALSDVASGWRAALLLAAVWVAVGLLLALALGVRASRLLGVNLSPAGDGPSPLEAQDVARAQVRNTLERLAGAVASEAEERIADAVVPIAGGHRRRR